MSVIVFEIMKVIGALQYLNEYSRLHFTSAFACEVAVVANNSDPVGIESTRTIRVLDFCIIMFKFLITYRANLVAFQNSVFSS